MAGLLLTDAGIALVCCGLTVAYRGHVRLALRLFLAGGGIFTGHAVIGRDWRGTAAALCTTALVAWLLWLSRRGQE